MSNMVLKEYPNYLDIANGTLAFKQDKPSINPNSCRYIGFCVSDTFPLSNKLNRVIKRGFDLFLSLVAIALIVPWLIPIIAIIIKLESRGPVFFLQKRFKRDGKTFTCIKFRSMYLNIGANTIASFENDKRITRFGRILRICHIDELPQFFNVLMGDMSIIGPRPYMISEDEKFQKSIPDYYKRYLIKPGITGLAQAKGIHGSVQDSEHLIERISLDFSYINNWSVLLDLRIMFQTFFMLFRHVSNKL